MIVIIKARPAPVCIAEDMGCNDSLLKPHIFETALLVLFFPVTAGKKEDCDEKKLLFGTNFLPLKYYVLTD